MKPNVVFEKLFCVIFLNDVTLLYDVSFVMKAKCYV